MKKLVYTLALATFASALAAPLTVNLNGKSVTLNTTVISGVPYIKAADLQKALAAGNTAAGGANQIAATDGCINEWLFNGIWRMRVTKLDIDSNERRYTVTVEVRNGSNESFTLSQVGMSYGNALMLIFPDGDSVSTGPSDKFERTQMIPGTGFIDVVAFGRPTNAPENQPLPAPQKFMLEVKRSERSSYMKSNFTVPDPSFRVDLTCKK